MLGVGCSSVGCCLSLLILLLSTLTAPAADYPQWWLNRGVIDPNATQVNDYALVNQGQVKNIAIKARDYLDSIPHVGAGQAVNERVDAFTQQHNYAPVNIGQLKNLAKPFYDRLIDVGYCTGYPWTETTVDDADYAAANIGQLKNLFNFDLCRDADGDGLPDWWENKYGLDPNVAANQDGAGGDPDEDHLTNAMEYELGSDPTDASDPGGLPNPTEFTAYNDLLWTASQGAHNNITIITGGDGPECPHSGLLVDYNTGAESTARLTATGGRPEFTDTMGAISHWGTEAYAVFAGKVDCRGTLQYAMTEFVLTFSELNPNLLYDIVLFGNRNRVDYLARNTIVALTGHVNGENRSTAGVTQEDGAGWVVSACHGWNTGNGYLMRWDNVDPGVDGIVACTIPAWDGVSQEARYYLNALMLQAKPRLDSDQDGMPDWWEDANGLDKNDSTDVTADGDGDLLPALKEYRGGCQDTNADSDGDGMDDGWEDKNNLDKRKDDSKEDADGDGVSNGTEYDSDTDASDPDDPSSGGDGASGGDDTIEIEIKVGDPSGSASEKYKLSVGSGVAVEGGPDTPSVESHTFVRGCLYDVTLAHVTSILESADCDYEAKIGGERSGSPSAGWLFGSDFCIHDETGLLGLYMPNTHPTKKSFEDDDTAILYVGLVEVGCAPYICRNIAGALSHVTVTLTSSRDDEEGLTGDLSVTIKDGDGSAVRTFDKEDVSDWEGAGDGAYACDWDGTDDAGAPVDPNTYTLEVRWNVDDNMDLGADIECTVVEITALTVTDKNSDSTVTVADANPAAISVAETLEAKADIELQINMLPDADKAGEHVLWTITGDTAGPADGNFAGGAANCTLTPADNNRIYTLTAGFDTSADATLDDGEILYTITITVVKIEKITLSTGEESTATSPEEAPTFYVAKDDDLTLTAVALPDSATWPDGKPVWSTEDVGPTLQVDTSEASENAEGTLYSAECGGAVYVRVVVIGIELGQTDDNTPIDPKNRICSNAQVDYKNVKYKVKITPNTCKANLTITGTASVEFSDGTTSKNNVTDGTFVTLTATDETTGTWKLTAESVDVPRCKDEEKEDVFKIVLATSAPSPSPNKTGNSNYGEWWVDFYAGKCPGYAEGGASDIKHAAEQRARRYAWFKTEPAGKYERYVNTRLRVEEEWGDGSSTGYGVKIWNEALHRSGDLRVSLTYGCVTVSAPIIGEQDLAAFDGRVKIKGPNDSSFNTADLGETVVVTSEISLFGNQKKKAIANSGQAETPHNHWKVGDSSSHAEAWSELAVTGGFTGDKWDHAGWGDAKFTAVVNVSIIGDIELTAASQP